MEDPQEVVYGDTYKPRKKAKKLLSPINSWDSVAKLLKVVDEIDTHIITLTGSDGKKYWVHREDNDE